jgi:tetratricopeptide (TPR) repeat protein
MFSRRRYWRGGGPGSTNGWALLLAGVVSLVPGRLCAAADLDTARQEFITGQYVECAASARAALAAKEGVEDWGELLAQSLLAQGKYVEAVEAATNALAADSRSIRLRWALRQTCVATGQSERAIQVLREIEQFFSGRNWNYRDPRDLVVYGQVALLGRMDPKMVLDRLYDRVKKSNPKLREVYLAMGELALDKHDFALAAQVFQEGLKQLPDDPDLHFGLAQAYAPSDMKLMLPSLTAALDKNTHHAGSLLLLADHSIDAEDYAVAAKFLDQVEAVNPWHPEGWAYRAVICHLRNQLEAESNARDKALKFWPTNPRVDYLIGLKLSQKYRFSLGATYQKRALAFDPAYLPAKIQLAQDLLRLGEEAEGWRLAEEVQRQDNYDVAANNLAALHDVIRGFQTLTNDQFILRLQPREASLYGRSALELLQSAYSRLGPKYGIKLPEPVLVEVFNKEKDFAVRTFGMPDNEGFLGVCFGHVITANSPGSRPGRHFNWQSMLWHEFCHVLTLQLTRNKMPRWLSEGISVYEERLADPSWGEHLNPKYREMLLGKDLTPLSQLSGAFLAPKSGVHLQFAYYQSSLVVQFVVERFGQEKLLAILRDLAEGAQVNDAVGNHTLPLPQLEKEFAAFARQTAESMAPGLNWDRPASASLAVGGRAQESDDDTEEPGAVLASPQLPPEAWAAWARNHPTNYWAMTSQADVSLRAKKWAEAMPVLEDLVKLYPGSTGSESAYRKLAAVYRALGNTNAETRVLTQFADRDDEAPDAYLRLMELGATAQDWQAVKRSAFRYLAVDPLVPAPYRFLARAGDALGQPPEAIGAYQALLLLDPPNPAEVHYRLAKLLHDKGDPAARRHVLEALEDAPRYRDALHLLRQMAQNSTNAVSQADRPREVPQ